MGKLYARCIGLFFFEPVHHDDEEYERQCDAERTGKVDGAVAE